MRFTTPCYVLVPQDKERDNLIKWLKKLAIKYIIIYGARM